MKPYGCWNSERKDSYVVPVRQLLSDGTLAYTTQTIVDTSSRDCRYDFRENDRQCDGCKK